MKKDKLISKNEVLLIIQNYIRSIQMNDYSMDKGIPELYHVMKEINRL